MTPSISIRPYEDGDVDAVLAAVHESKADLSPWMPWYHPNYSAADAANWVRATREGHSSGAHYDFAIICDGSHFGGACGINHVNPLDCVANLGYWVRSSLAGRGVAAAAVSRL